MFDDLSPHTRAQQHLEHPREESPGGNPQLSIQHCCQQLWHPEITQHPRPSAPRAYKHQIILGKPDYFGQFPVKHQPAVVPNGDFLERHHKRTKCRVGPGWHCHGWGHCEEQEGQGTPTTALGTKTALGYQQHCPCQHRDENRHDTHTCVHHLGWGGRLHPTWAPFWDGVTSQG